MARALLAVAAALAAVAAATSGVSGRVSMVRPEEVAARNERLETAMGGRFGIVTSEEARVEDNTVCLFGRAYVTNYNVSIPQESQFVRLDTSPGYHSVVCNVDHTDLEVRFSSASEASAFAARAAAGAPVLTGKQGVAECERDYGMFRRVSHVDGTVRALRLPEVRDEASGAVVSAATDVHAVRVRVFKATYDQTMKSGTVSFGAAELDSPAHALCAQRAADARAAALRDPAHFCLGINTNDQCTGARRPLNFFQNQYVSLDCPDCYLAFEVDVGLKLKLKDFLLYDSAFKFSNMKMQGNMQALMNAQYSWGLNADATTPLIAPKNLVQFWVGPIPVTIGFELPLQKTAEASFFATANAQVGAQLEWTIGDYGVTWNPLKGWKHDAKIPGLVYKTAVSGDAKFNGNANFGLAPSLSVHLDSFFKTTVAFSSDVKAAVSGDVDKMQVCGSGSYSATGDSSAELDISIPWINLDKSWKWSETWFNLNGALDQRCVSASNISHVVAAVKKQQLLEQREQAQEQEQQEQKQALAAAAAAAPVVLSTSTLSSSAAAAPPAEVLRYSGKHHTCMHGKGYTASYDVSVPSNYTFVDLANFPGVKKVVCNAGANQFRVEFHHKSERESFERAAVAMTSFLTGDQALSAKCGGQLETKVFLMRTLHVKDTSIPLINHQVEVTVAEARYDEIFAKANMSLGVNRELDCSSSTNGNNNNPVVIPEANITKHVCLGVNSDDCATASGSIPLYTSEYMTVTCKDCFVAAQADIFFDLELDDFHLNKLQGGFKNIQVDAALLLEADAQAAWNSGTNVTKDVMPPTTILSFAAGPVPIRVWFEIPLTKFSQMSADAQASITAGVTGRVDIGDFYMQWQKGWSVVKPHRPVISLKPQVGAPTAQFSASAVLSLIPSFGFHVDSVFGTTFLLNPTLNVHANASLATNQACLSSSARVEAIGSAYLDINVAFDLIHIGGSWGPQTLYDSGDHQIEDKCVNLGLPAM